MQNKNKFTNIQRQILSAFHGSETPPQNYEIELHTFVSQFGKPVFSQLNELEQDGYVKHREERIGVRISHYYKITDFGLQTIESSSIQTTSPDLEQSLAKLVKPYIFISYSRKNLNVMREISKDLKQENISFWVDEHLLEVGMDWEMAIEIGLKGAKAVLALMSPDAKNSPWVRIEVKKALDQNLKIFPVLIDGDQETSIPLALYGHQYIDLRGEEYMKGFQLLSSAVIQYLASGK
jgi:DNA-binding PadR family transcriptional regulator